MTNDKVMTLAEAHGLVRGLLHQHPKGVIVRDAWEVLDAHLAQHAAMVAKLRELCLTIRQDDRGIRWCAAAIEDILSTEPTEKN